MRVLLILLLTLFCVDERSIILANEQDSTKTEAFDDPVAKIFSAKCAACHTFGKGDIKGPDLIKSINKKRTDIVIEVGRMQTKSGPMSENEIQDLTDFILDPQAASRLETQAILERKLLEAVAEPANAERGGALYNGSATLKNGGLSCISCHTAFDQRGFGSGKLGPTLTGVSTKFGKDNLARAIRQSGFLIMKPIYEKHPITLQESIDIAEYITQNDLIIAEDNSTYFFMISITGAGFALLGFFFVYRHRLISVRKTIYQ